MMACSIFMVFLLCLGVRTVWCPLNQPKTCSTRFQQIERLVREGIDPEGSPVLGFLIAGDFEGLIHFAEDLGYQEVEEGYVSKCDLCLDIRKYLVAKGGFKELSPKEFYDHLE